MLICVPILYGIEFHKGANKVRLKITTMPLYGQEVYHINSIELCRIFASECKAFNANEAEYYWGKYMESTCFRLKMGPGERIYLTYSPLAFYITEGCDIVEYKPLQRSE